MKQVLYVTQIFLNNNDKIISGVFQKNEITGEIPSKSQQQLNTCLYIKRNGTEYTMQCQRKIYFVCSKRKRKFFS